MASVKPGLRLSRVAGGSLQAAGIVVLAPARPRCPGRESDPHRGAYLGEQLDVCPKVMMMMMISISIFIFISIYASCSAAA